jgi:predicted SAM-dependent methyltransferase
VKLNIGCGRDYREGYVNVDLYDSGIRVDRSVDISKVPWPWPDGSADEILMLDVLEHIEHGLTRYVLLEAWRTLRTNGELIVQVPDLDHVACAATLQPPFLCNMCGQPFANAATLEYRECPSCGRDVLEIQMSAIRRLYGGQDGPGNYHKTAFTGPMLVHALETSGFFDVTPLEIEHQKKNWNIKVSARKGELGW